MSETTGELQQMILHLHKSQKESKSRSADELEEKEDVY